MSDLILVETVEPGIALVTLNRPEKKNALSIALLESLCAALDRLTAEKSQRAVVLRGAGSAFSAGLDLCEAADHALVERSALAVQGALEAVQKTPLAMIAAVQGGAFAGGAGLMAACDVVVAADDAQIGFPEARRGLLPALICQVLKHKVREGDLRDLFLTGDPVDARRAQEMGLVQRIAPSARLLESAMAVARSVQAGGPETVRSTKLLLNDVFKHADDGAASPAIQAHLAARHSAEAREGLAAFLEKRTPRWI